MSVGPQAARPVAAPWRELGLKDSEYERICELLGRAPNPTELGMFAVLWSEHCAYKHSKAALGILPTAGPQVVLGPGENAGVVRIAPDAPLVALRMESHNHPAAVEPYQGAATGVGGILRDILAAGARPVALLNSLRFGPLDSARARSLVGGVVAGIAGYGNAVGVPNVGGEVAFGDGFRHNPLVNVMCVGLVAPDRLLRAQARGEGNLVFYVGAPTGRDGIHGATFASEELGEGSAERLPSVQVGDPFWEKLLVEACLQLAAEGCVAGIQDMGAAGLTSAAAETAARGGTGILLDLDKVPLREADMTPYEILLSESQERMLVIAEPGREERVREICRRFGLPCEAVGRVRDDGLLRVVWRGEEAACVPARALTGEAPVYRPTGRRPPAPPTLDPAKLPPPPRPGEALRALLQRPNVCSKEWVYTQYDYQVRTATVRGPGAADAAVLRLFGTRRALALAVDGNARYCALDPYRGGALAVAEAARNVACVGARPLAVTNCLNFGSPERPEVFWAFEQVLAGMAAACRALDTPVTGGNVSFYNEHEGRPIPPTPIIGMLGVLEDAAQSLGLAFAEAGDTVVLVGPPGDGLGGSEYLAWLAGRDLGPLPALDLKLERRVQDVLVEAAARGWLRSAHDCSEGGLAVAVAESCIAGGVGARLAVPGGARPDVPLFGEAPSRVVVSLPPARLPELEALCRARRVPCTLLGEVGGEELVIDAGPGARLAEPVTALAALWRGSLAGALAAGPEGGEGRGG